MGLNTILILYGAHSYAYYNYIHLGSGVVERLGEGRGPSSLATSLVAFLQSAKYCALSAPGRMEQRRRAVVPTLAKKVRSLFGGMNRSG